MRNQEAQSAMMMKAPCRTPRGCSALGERCLGREGASTGVQFGLSLPQFLDDRLESGCGYGVCQCFGREAGRVDRLLSDGCASGRRWRRVGGCRPRLGLRTGGGQLHAERRHVGRPQNVGASNGPAFDGGFRAARGGCFWRTTKGENGSLSGSARKRLSWSGLATTGTSLARCGWMFRRSPDWRPTGGFITWRSPGRMIRGVSRGPLRIYIRDVTGQAADSPRYKTAFAQLPRDKWRLFRDPTEIREALASAQHRGHVR